MNNKNIQSLDPTYSTSPYSKERPKHHLLYGILFLVCAAAIIVVCFGFTQKEAFADIDFSMVEKADSIQRHNEDTFLFEADYESFSYLLGMGGWSTDMTVNRDGSFSGYFHDNDLGVIGDEYPNGTVYVCNFHGRFNQVAQINSYTFELSLEELETDLIDVTQIKDGTMYISAEPYGLEKDKHYLLYTPDAPLDELPEALLFWWELRFADAENSNWLNTYALCCDDLCCCFLTNKQ